MKKVATKTLVARTNKYDKRHYNAQPAQGEYYTQWHEGTLIRDSRNNPLVLIPKWARGHKLETMAVMSYTKNPEWSPFVVKLNCYQWATSRQRVYNCGYLEADNHTKEHPNVIVRVFVKLAYEEYVFGEIK